MKNKTVLVLTIIGVVAVIGMLIWQATMLNGILVALRAGWVPVLLLIGVVAFGWIGMGQDRLRWIAVAVLFIGGLITFFAVAGYQTDKTRFQNSVTLDDAPISEYQARAPFVIAKAQTEGHLSTNGVIEETSYLPGTNKFGTAVRGPNFADGYVEVVQQTVSPSGQSVTTNCTFDAHTPRFQGWFGANLTRAIIREAGFGTIITESDSFAWCEDDKPMIVVPLKQRAGAIFTYEVPAGIAVVDGSTGTISIERNVEAGKYPGPVYPMSLSEQQWSATQASGSWWQYINTQVGFRAPGDDDAENASNNADFLLARTDQTGADFLTPLALQGDSQGISAVAVLPATQVTRSQLNPMVVHELADTRQSNSATIDRLRGDHGSLPEWAAGMQVYEIAPTGPDTWTATLGLRQAIVYRAEINADGSSCLFNARGQQVRCSGEQQTEQPGTNVEVPTDLSTLTDEELEALAHAIIDELARRGK